MMNRNGTKVNDEYEMKFNILIKSYKFMGIFIILSD